MKTLRSFVSDEDFSKLLDILWKIKEGTLKDEVSVLVITGKVCSGKSTLIDIMRKISPSYGEIGPKTIISADSRVKSRVLEYCNSHLIRIGLYDEDPSLEGIHDWIEASTGKLYRKPTSFQEPYLMKRIDPGVFIIESPERPLTENFKKNKRLPMILNLPNKFDISISREKIVEKCVKEFSVTNSLNARRASLFFVRSVENLPLPVEIVIMIAKKVWGTRKERCWMF